MNNTIKDVNNNEVVVGDTILLAKHSEFYKAKYMGRTPKAIKISCLRKKWIAEDPSNQDVSNWARHSTKGSWIEDPKGEIHHELDVSKHNGYKRISFWSGTPDKTDTILKIS